MAKKKLTVNFPSVSIPPESKWEPILLIFGGLLLVVFAVLVGTTNTRWYIPNEGAIPQIDALLIFIPGILLFFFGFKVTSNYSSSEDISPLQAGIGFILCLVVGVIMRLYHMDIPFGGWWGEQTFQLFTPWDWLVHHHIQLINEWGWNPAFPYCVVIEVFKIFPNLSGPATLKVTCTIFDMGSIAIFYFLGKEVSGRRTGIIMASLGVISREMITVGAEYIGISSIFFIIGLTLLVFFRLIHKPTFWRFVQWGTVMAFGLYVDNVYRVWVPFVFVAVSFWIIFRPEQPKLSLWSYGVSLGGPLVWIIWYFRALHFISENSSIVNCFFLILIGFVFISFVQLIRRFRAYSSDRLSLGLGLGLVIAGVLFYPLEATGNLFQRTNEVIDLKSILSFRSFYEFFTGYMAKLINVLFVDGHDLPWVGPDHQTLFSLDNIVLIFLGFAFLMAKPSREKIWILLAIVPGVLPYVITDNSSDPSHYGRLVGVLPPLYLLAALGLDRFWGIFSKKAGTGSLRFFGLIFLIAFWICAGWANIQSVWAWSSFPKSVLVNVWKQAESEVGRGRVYIAPFGIDYDNLEALQVLIDHQDIYGLGSSNPIFLSSEQKTPNVIVFCPNDDEKNLKILRKEFPRAQWTEVLDRSVYRPTFHLWKIQISGNQITANNKQLIFVSKISSDIWTRKFYGSDYGMGKGVVFFEDAVTDPHAPFSFVRENWMGSAPFSVRLEKKVEIEKSGPYIFSVQSIGCIRLMVKNDEKYKIFDRDTYGKDEIDSKTVQLEKGTYQAEYCCVSEDNSFPKITIQSSNGFKTEW